MKFGEDKTDESVGPSLKHEASLRNRQWVAKMQEVYAANGLDGFAFCFFYSFFALGDAELF